MKKDIAMKGVMIAGCLCILLLLFHVCVQLKGNSLVDLKTTYIAAHDIAPRSLIKEEDLIEVKIPANYLLDHAVNDKKKIIGRYTDIQGKIPAGSVFYASMLYNAEQMPDHPAQQLRNGQAAYSIETDVASLGSITAAMRIDVHVSIQRRDNVPVTGCLIENARVISVKDHQGVSIEDPKSTGIPYVIEIAVNKDDLDLLELARNTGEFRLYANSDSYHTDTEASLCQDSEAVKYLQSLQMQENANIKSPEILLNPSDSESILFSEPESDR